MGPSPLAAASFYGRENHATVMFNDRPEVRALMEYWTTPQSVSGWMQSGGALASQQTVTPDMYGVDLESGIATLVAAAPAFASTVPT